MLISGEFVMMLRKQAVRWLSLWITVLVILVSSQNVFAQEGAGVRAGISADPEQFYFGGHGTFGPVIERLWFRPNLEVGVGNDLTVIALNGEFTYWIPLQRDPWNVYFGGGPAMNILSFDSDRVRDGDTDVRPGFN